MRCAAGRSMKALGGGIIGGRGCAARQSQMGRASVWIARPDLESEIGAEDALGVYGESRCDKIVRQRPSLARTCRPGPMAGEVGGEWQYARITASQSDMVRPTVHPAVLNRGKHSRIYEPRLLDLPAH